MISPIHSPARCRAARTARWFTAVAAALCGLALSLTGAAQAGAATVAGPARVPAGSLSTLHPIAVNTANWSGSAGFGSRPPAWYKDKSGVIHLQGAVSQTSASGTGALTIGTLPPAARPAKQVFTIVHTFNGTYAQVVISTAGDIFIGQPDAPAVQDYSFVSLEGITYSPSKPGTPIALTTANFTTFPCCGPPVWYKDSSGVVHLEGDAYQTSTGGTSPNLIGTLPASAAPAHAVYTVVACAAGTYADLAIEPNGTINLINPRSPAQTDYGVVALWSISYRPGGAGTPIGLNTANWSGSAGFDSRPPAWYKDSSGIVHLQGAVTQTSVSGTTPNLIGTLPAAAAPRHSVYTIVHTFNGTYADLSIGPNGQISLIDPRSPMVKDYTFASLEGITYRR
jgi:hypothetical protein